jgi:hypothetical protein
MVEKQKALENIEWSSRSHRRIQLSAMILGRVSVRAIVLKINNNGRSRSSASSHCPSALTVAVIGPPWLGDALPISNGHTYLCDVMCRLLVQD